MTTPAQTWYTAAAPDYGTNFDLQYPYSEMPDFNSTSYGYYVTPAQGTLQIVDYFGCGQTTANGKTYGFPRAYNVNDQFAVVGSGTAAKKVPNRVPWTTVSGTQTTSPYLPNRCATFVTFTSTGGPAVITAAVANDMARVVSGSLFTFGLQAGDAQLATIATAMASANVIVDRLTPLPFPLTTNTVTPVATFSPVATVQAAVRQALLNGDLEDVAQQIAAMYRTADASSIPSLITTIKSVDVTLFFPVMARAGLIIGTNYSYSFVGTYGGVNQDMQLLLQAVTNPTYFYLRSYPTMNGRSTEAYMNAKGQQDGNQWDVSIDKSGGSSFYADLDLANRGIRLKVGDGNGGWLYVHPQGKQWSGGPSYYVTSSSDTTNATFKVQTVDQGQNGLYFHVASDQGEIYMNSMGDQWGSGPAFWITTDLLSRTNSNFVWNMNQP